MCIRDRFREVIGAAMKAVNIDRICPKANATPKADKVPFHRIQLVICSNPVLISMVNVDIMIIKMIAGIIQPIIFEDIFFGGTLDLSLIHI